MQEKERTTYESSIFRHFVCRKKKGQHTRAAFSGILYAGKRKSNIREQHFQAFRMQEKEKTTYEMPQYVYFVGNLLKYKRIKISCRKAEDEKEENMDQLKEILEARESELKRILEQAEYTVKGSPDQMLRIIKKGKHVQFYVRKKEDEDKNHNGKYLKADEKSLANKIAQRDYAEKVIKAAKNQLELVRKMIARYDENAIQLQYENLNDERKKLVQAYTLSDEEYVKKWETREPGTWNQHKENLLFQTNKGELVRSKSEKILADKFGLMNIPYQYEKPLILAKNIVLHPDFTLLNVAKRKEYYWEHLGMMDQDVYCKKAVQKLEMYELNGIIPGKNLILTMESKENPLNMCVVEKMIQEFLM